MAGTITNRGRRVLAEAALKNTGHAGGTAISNFKMVLVTSAVAPTVDSNDLSALTQVANGNGYTTGGVTVERSATGWDTFAQDDTSDKATCKAKDISWTASSGNIPASGNGPRYACLVDDAATPNLIAFWDLGSSLTILDGATFKLEDTEIDFTLPA